MGGLIAEAIEARQGSRVQAGELKGMLEDFKEEDEEKEEEEEEEEEDFTLPHLFHTEH